MTCSSWGSAACCVKVVVKHVDEYPCADEELCSSHVMRVQLVEPIHLFVIGQVAFVGEFGVGCGNFLGFV